MKKPCIACKELIPAGDRFCMHCGVEQVAKPEVVASKLQVEAMPAAEPIAVAASEVKVEEQKPCVACKEQIPADDRFCMHCGVEQVAKPEVVAAPEAVAVVEPVVAAPAAEVVAASEVKAQQPAELNPLEGIPVEIGAAKESSAPDVGPSLPAEATELKTASFEHKSDYFGLELIDIGDSEVIKSPLSIETPMYENGPDIEEDFYIRQASFCSNFDITSPDDIGEKVNKLEIPKYLRRDNEISQTNAASVTCKGCAAKIPVYSRFCLICGVSQAEEVITPKTEEKLEGLHDVSGPVDVEPVKDFFGQLTSPQSRSAGSQSSILPDDVTWRKSMAQIRLRQERARQDLARLIADKDWWRNGK